MEYVRWTLNRNMKSYISLIDNQKINISSLIDNIEPIQNAKRFILPLKRKRDQFLLFLNITLKMKKIIKPKISFIKKIWNFLISISWSWRILKRSNHSKPSENEDL